MTDPHASSRHPAGSARPHWGAEALWQALVPLLPGLSIEVVQSIASTNTELAERLRNAARVTRPAGDRREGRVDDLSPQLLVAIDQTAGRGRLGRHWRSAPGSSLTFSLALPLQRADWSGLSLAVGLQRMRLRPEPPVEAGVDHQHQQHERAQHGSAPPGRQARGDARRHGVPARRTLTSPLTTRRTWPSAATRSAPSASTPSATPSGMAASVVRTRWPASTSRRA